MSTVPQVASLLQLPARAWQHMAPLAWPAAVMHQRGHDIVRHAGLAKSILIPWPPCARNVQRTGQGAR
jgi:hypothetical protein